MPLFAGDGTTIVLIDAIKKVFCFGMVQRAGHPLRGNQVAWETAICEQKGTKIDALKKLDFLLCFTWLVLSGKLGIYDPVIPSQKAAGARSYRKRSLQDRYEKPCRRRK